MIEHFAKYVSTFYNLSSTENESCKSVYSTGLSQLDECIMLEPGTLTYFGGNLVSGKINMACQLIKNMCIMHRVPTAYIGTETFQNVTKHVIEQAVNHRIGDIGLEDKDVARIATSQLYLSHSLTVEDLIHSLEEMVGKYCVKVVIIDDVKCLNSTHDINNLLKDVAKILDIVLIVMINLEGNREEQVFFKYAIEDDDGFSRPSLDDMDTKTGNSYIKESLPCVCDLPKEFQYNIRRVNNVMFLHRPGFYGVRDKSNILEVLVSWSVDKHGAIISKDNNIPLLVNNGIFMESADMPRKGVHSQNELPF